jgi:phage terminase large subunit-like protein
MQADIEHVKTVQEHENYRFDIRPLGGNSLSKVDRIRRLVPVFEQGKFWLPRRLLFSRSDGTQADFVAELVNDEYTGFPVAKHDDMLDDLSRIVDPALGAVFPALASAEGLFSAAPAVQIETALTNPKYQLFG